MAQAHSASRRWRRFLGKLIRLANQAFNSPVRFSNFALQMVRFMRASREEDGTLPVFWRDQHPCLEDDTASTDFDRHYVMHTSWASRVLAEIRPALHVDIASSLFFVGNVSAFVPVQFYDYRPADLGLTNLTSDRADLLALPFADRSVKSISCMHVVEHVGLGRYGDPIDPLGDSKAMAELQRVVAPQGSLLFVVPVGRPRVCFNAHRVYGFEMIKEAFDELELVQFGLIPDDQDPRTLIIDPDISLIDEQHYACGCFWFKRAL